MADQEFEAKQLEQFTERVKSSLMFECACCYLRRRVPDDIGDVKLYHAKSRMIANQMETKAAPYVLCKKCLQEVPPQTRDQRVLECLAAHGLFD